MIRGHQLGREVAMIVDDRQIARCEVIQLTRRFRFEQEISHKKRTHLY